MNEPALTNAQLQAIQKIAQDMGLNLDELGHPVRQGEHYELDGQPYQRLHDFNPQRDPGDAFRVQLYYNLALEVEQDVIVVREGLGPILMCDVVHIKTPEGRVDAACDAVVRSAAKLLARREFQARAFAGE